MSRLPFWFGSLFVPNGGFHDCLHCSHYLKQQRTCSLRNVVIEGATLTTCRNFNRPGKEIHGPLYAIVCEAKNRCGTYWDIPYFDGQLVNTVQPDGQGDTVVRFTDSNGTLHEFETVAAYLRFYKASGREL